MYNRKNYNSKSEGNVLPEPFVQTGLITFFILWSNTIFFIFKTIFYVIQSKV